MKDKQLKSCEAYDLVEIFDPNCEYEISVEDFEDLFDKFDKVYFSHELDEFFINKKAFMEALNE